MKKINVTFPRLLSCFLSGKSGSSMDTGFVKFGASYSRIGTCNKLHRSIHLVASLVP